MEVLNDNKKNSNFNPGSFSFFNIYFFSGKTELIGNHKKSL